MCVLLQEGMLAAVRNKEWTAMLTDASMKGKKTIIMQISDGIIMDVFIIYRFAFALCYHKLTLS